MCIRDRPGGLAQLGEVQGVVPCGPGGDRLKQRPLDLLPQGQRLPLGQPELIEQEEPVSYTHLDVYKRQIQGILFGPIAFITIPIGNVIGGAMHDYFSGMICLRDGGTQMPDMVRKRCV